jgi:hypothetical protein
MNSLFESSEHLVEAGQHPEARKALLTALSEAIAGADAYAAVRSAVNREGENLRVGNLFTHISRVREIAFVAAGHAALPMASALVAALGDSVTQGLVLTSVGEAPDLPFQIRRVTEATLPSSEGSLAATEALELASGLKTGDLFLPLLSPGSLGMLATPEEGVTLEVLRTEVSRALTSDPSGPLSSEVAGALSRAQGGKLAGAAGQATVEALVVERGEGAAWIGGGPASRPASGSGGHVRSFLEESGTWQRLPSPLKERIEGGERLQERAPRGVHVVSIEGPREALESAGAACGQAKHRPTLLWVHDTSPPGTVAHRFVKEAETALRRPLPKGFRGNAALAGLTLGLPEGVVREEPLREFLETARRELRRRDVTIALLQTAGSVGSGKEMCVGMVDAESAPAYSSMRGGFTDVGTIAVAWKTVTPGPNT